MWDQIVATAEPHSKLDMVGFPCVNRSAKAHGRSSTYRLL